jgi:hypothetical protein
VVIGKLTPLNDSNSLTWKQGKTQIRALLRESNIKAVGTFRQRKENNKEYRLGVPGGVAVAERVAGADVRIVLEAPATEAPSAPETASGTPDLIAVELAGNHAGALAEVEAVNARIRELKGHHARHIEIANVADVAIEFPNS